MDKNKIKKVIKRCFDENGDGTLTDIKLTLLTNFEFCLDEIKEACDSLIKEGKLERLKWDRQRKTYI